MHRLTACVGAIAMFLALLTAPLFHLHNQDDHGDSVSLVHAHLLDIEDSDHHSDDSIEERDSHTSARYVDFFTFGTPLSGVDLIVELTKDSVVAVLEVSEGMSLDAVPQSHGPPPTRLSIPRSPPAA